MFRDEYCAPGAFGSAPCLVIERRAVATNHIRFCVKCFASGIVAFDNLLSQVGKLASIFGVLRESPGWVVRYSDIRRSPVCVSVDINANSLSPRIRRGGATGILTMVGLAPRMTAVSVSSSPVSEYRGIGQ